MRATLFRAGAAGLFLMVGCLVLAERAFSVDQAPQADEREAKKAFGAIKNPPAIAQAQAIGRYERGCVAGAQQLSANGAGWQAMRLSRNRFWGHPVLIAYLKKLASDVTRLDGLSGILVGDMAQPIGGPLLGGHASHQMGLDVDLWYKLSPERTLSGPERESLAADNVVDQSTLTVIPTLFTEAQAKLLRRASSYPEVARIFVHPAIKKALCDAAGTDRSWLRKIRPWYRHDDHFHVRLDCPKTSPSCIPQAAVPDDDGCGTELDDWFKKLRPPSHGPDPSHKPPVIKPQKPMLVSDMPQECQALLSEAENAAKAETSR